ncbi:MAG: MIP/aquaporin family protein [Candidatus Limnocylindria bacterium]
MSREITVTLTDQGRALLAEAAGTFMFISIGAGAVVAHEMTGGLVGLVGIALASGLALAVAVSTFGAISGAHFNPAVTFGLWVAGKHPRDRVLTYWAAQIAGALAAGIFLRIAFGHAQQTGSVALFGTPGLAPGLDPLTAVFIELVLTVFLLWAVFGTAVSPNAPRIAGFGIGLVYSADILIGGPLTGAAMNPARWIGPAAAAGHFDDWYVYWTGPLLGGALAGLSYKYFFASEVEREPIVVAAPEVPPDKERTQRI